MAAIHFYSVTKDPGFSVNSFTASKDNKRDKICYVSNIDAKFNNSVTNVNTGFTNRVIEKLQQSNYCKEVFYGLHKPDKLFYDLRFNIEENQDLNTGSNITKAIFTGLTLFLLAPALPNTYDFSTDHCLQVTRPDGTKREYKASCAGSATGTYPYTGLVKENSKMMGDVTEKCLLSVISQFIADNEDQQELSNNPALSKNPVPSNNPVDRLNRLKKAYESGLITEEEYADKKKQILNEL
jgi:hypothetical protein